MLITRCPYRVSFFGGGTDFPSWYKEHGCSIISSSIDAFCYVTIRKLLPFYGNDYRISWSRIEEVNNIQDIEHPAIRGALDYLNIKNGLEIHTDGDLPARSGLGSSSAFSAALLLALHQFNNERISTKDLTEKTIHFEQEILKENVGIQDQIQTCNGGFNLLSINKEGNYRILRVDNSSPLVKEVSSKMLLLFTGESRTSSIIQNEIQKTKPKIRYESLKNIARIANEVRKRILDENLSFFDFSDYLEESWEHKIKLFPDSPAKENLQYIYKEAKKAGALSGKLLGAGGGGFFLFLVEEKFQKKFKEQMGNYTVVKHNVTNTPCEIVFNSSI